METNEIKEVLEIIDDCIEDLDKEIQYGYEMTPEEAHCELIGVPFGI